MIEPRDVTPSVPQALGHLRVALDDAYARASREFGLTAQQAELLCAAMNPAATNRLAETLRCDRTNVTRLVDRAIARGWVARSPGPEDRRVSLISLTPSGERLARRFISRLEGDLSPLLGTWSEERRRSTADTLSELAAALDRQALRRPELTRPEHP